jgi:SAM-dependent methyltransferase
MSVEAIIAKIGRKNHSRWAWQNYTATVLDLIEGNGANAVIEIGGGRFPLFKQDDVERLGISYTSNDISQRELDRAPVWANKARFDVQTPDRDSVAPFAESFDFAFSKMVMEHVASYRRAYANLFTILRPGGLAIAFHPTLYALPFVVNKLMPESASSKLLKLAFPDRHDDGIPKFPAFYDGCVISDSVRKTISGIGFRDMWQIPFYGHGYYNKFPLVRNAHAVITQYAMRHDITQMATFSYTIVRK